VKGGATGNGGMTVGVREVVAIITVISFLHCLVAVLMVIRCMAITCITIAEKKGIWLVRGRAARYGIVQAIVMIEVY